MNSSSPGPEIASNSALREALTKLTDAELLRLKRIAQLRASGLEIEWGDLLNEAIARSLSGTRAWPVDVPFMAFLVQTMRSIANEYWRQMNESVVALSADLTADSDLDAFVGVDSKSPERQVVAERTLRDIEDLFRNDSDALGVLRGMALGMTAEEIRHSSGLDQRQYETVQKRIRRGITRAFAKEDE